MGLNPQEAVVGMIVAFIVIPTLGACVLGVLFGVIYAICRLTWG